MDSLDLRAFVIDGGSGRVVTYGDLRAQLSRDAAAGEETVPPEGVMGLLVALAGTLVFGRSLTLGESAGGVASHRLRTEESAASPGGSAAVPGSRFGSVEEMIGLARQRTDARLTIFTSGSTGLPKKVTHGLESLGRMLRVSDRHADDVWGLAYSPSHVAGVQVFLQAFYNANTMVNVFRLGREAVLEQIRRHGVTHLSATPSFFRMLFPIDEPIGSIRVVTVGGERADAGLLKDLGVMFPAARMRNIYASTEAGSILEADGDVFSIPKEMVDSVRVVGGQIEVHRGLLGEFDCGSEALKDGDWYQTGDRVEVIRENPLRFRIVSRERDWVNVGGDKVNPADVEAVLRQYRGVREARVWGRRNSVLGSVLQAEIVADPEPAERDLRRFLEGRLRAHEVPRFFSFVTSIECTWTGKLKRC